MESCNHQAAGLSHSPSVTTMTGMLSLCLVLWDRRRNPYSSEYSTMYSSCGHTETTPQTNHHCTGKTPLSCNGRSEHQLIKRGRRGGGDEGGWSLPALVIISSSDTESLSGCIPLVVWLKETSWLSLAAAAPPIPPTPPPIRDGFRRGSMSSSNCSKDKRQQFENKENKSDRC